jgi:hypothetical protein
VHYCRPVGLQEDLAVVHQAMGAISDAGRVASRVLHDDALGSRTCFLGALAGRPFEALAWHGCTRRHGPIDCVRDVTVKVSLPIPIRLLIADTRMSSASLPRLATGDGAFDSTVRLFGFPEDVLHSAFDAAARAELWSSVSHRLSNLIVQVRDGALTHELSLPGPPYTVHTAMGGDLGAFHAQVALVLRLADRLTSAYQRVLLNVRARGGPAAEAAWLARAQAALETAASKERRFHAFLYVFMVVLVAVGVAGVLLWW